MEINVAFRNPRVKEVIVGILNCSTCTTYWHRSLGHYLDMVLIRHQTEGDALIQTRRLGLCLLANKMHWSNLDYFFIR